MRTFMVYRMYPAPSTAVTSDITMETNHTAGVGRCRMGSVPRRYTAASGM